MKSIFSYCLFSILFLSTLGLSAQDNWRQFRGDNRNGSSADSKINEKWPELGPDLVWKKNIGGGFSEILISQDRIFTMIGEKTDSVSGSEFMVAYDSKTGEEIWKTLVDSMIIDPEGTGEGPRSTPIIDDKSVYCFSTFGKLRALSLEDGKILWTADFMKELSLQVMYPTSYCLPALLLPTYLFFHIFLYWLLRVVLCIELLHPDEP